MIYLINLIGLIIDEILGHVGHSGPILARLCTWLSFATLKEGLWVYCLRSSLSRCFLTLFRKFNPPGNFTEQYGLLFQFLTLYLFIRSEEQGSPDATLKSDFALLHLGIGALGAVSFLLQTQPRRPLDCSIGIYWVFMRGTSLHKLLWAVAGGGERAYPCCGSSSKAFGALGALWDAVFVYNLRL